MVDQPALLPASSGSPPPEAGCAHHWRIESPAGETSEGVCKLCGATRLFSNYSRHQAMSRTRRAPASRAGESQTT